MRLSIVVALFVAGCGGSSEKPREPEGLPASTTTDPEVRRQDEAFEQQLREEAALRGEDPDALMMFGELPPLSGACECLEKSLPKGHNFTRDTARLLAARCLGGDGSDRLYRNQACLPFAVQVDGEPRYLDYYLTGCIVPRSGVLMALREPVSR